VEKAICSALVVILIYIPLTASTACTSELGLVCVCCWRCIDLFYRGCLRRCSVNDQLE